MKYPFALLLCISWILPSSAVPAFARKSSDNSPRFKEMPQPAVAPAGLGGVPLRSAAAADTFNLGWFSFDSAGLGNPQGWTTVDLTTQPLHWHVASGAGELDGGNLGNLLPLEGNQSMWCGQAPSSDPPYCGWASLPGYGNGWDQIFLGNTLPGDSARISYKVFWDSEPGYDGTTFEWSGDGGLTWARFPVAPGLTARTEIYDGGPATLVETFTQGGMTTVQFRYRFTADGAWSDEDGLWPTDGAILLDSISVDTWAAGIPAFSNFEDFEGAAEGDTAAGMWTATVPEPFGDFGSLYRGATLLQEDPCFTDLTFLWGWFDDPARTGYWCHVPDPRPDVGAMPYGNSQGQYIGNEIWSPPIDNIGAGSEYRLEFLTYRDLALDNMQFYIWSVRSVDAAGCPGTWNNDNYVYFGGQKDWIRTSFQVGAHLDPTAPRIQLSIGVRDMCGVWYCFGENCHSHAPLIDEVHIKRINVVGPQFVIRHIDLFQDNFAADGTLTGTARADAANDIAPFSSPTILPGDSVTMDITNLGTDAFTGEGPAGYVFVAVWPQGQAAKTGADIEAPETRANLAAAGGKRYPLVAGPVLGGVQWYQFRMDTSFTNGGAPVADRWAIDLNDNLFTPGDTVCYFFGADNGAGNATYFHRKLNGQGGNWATTDILEAANSPMEFTILPAGGNTRGGDILYVDDTDDRGGPAQLYFDTAFDYLALRDKIDRYDVLGPSSGVSNSLGARVQNVATQIMGPYRNIIWNSGNLSSNLINDGGTVSGGGSLDKSPDFSLIFRFLDTHTNHPGFYYSADDGAYDWHYQMIGPDAVNTRSIYMNFNLDPSAPNGDHKTGGEPVSPVLDAVGPIGFATADRLVAYGGCPGINDFDLLQATGLSVAEFNNAATGKTYVLSQTTPNAAGSVARFVMSGFSYHYIRDLGAPGAAPARVTHLQHILQFLQNAPPGPSGFDKPKFNNVLDPSYPNPFNPGTTIPFEIKKSGHVSLKIYNVSGQLVKTLLDGELPAGRYAKEPFNRWDGTNDAGQPVGSGVYFYRILTRTFTKTMKLVVLR
ncbi:MAG: T9SS type A sorting domain-containing protein [Candidatus Krumholzibacteriia bacterium]